MSLPRFAEVADVEARLGRPFAGDEIAQCEAFLDDASMVIRAEAGRTWLNDSGDALVGTEAQLDALRTVCANMAARVMRNPSGANQRTAGPFSESYAPSVSAAHVYLSKSDRKVLAWVVGRSGVGTLSTTRGPIETTPIRDWVLRREGDLP